jgi:hypothetical protein
MLSIGLMPSDADPRLFTGALAGSRLLVGLSVDDASLSGSTNTVKAMVTELRYKFEVKDVGSLPMGVTMKFQGMELARQGGSSMRQER